MKQCSNDHCKNDVFNGHDECVLHCEKGIALGAPDKKLFSSFYDALVDYIVTSAVTKYKIVQPPMVGNLTKYLMLGFIDQEKEVIKFCEFSLITTFRDIRFPAFDDEAGTKFQNLLIKIKRTHFDKCKFTASSINAPNIEVFFENCEFLCPWSITPLKLLKKVNNANLENKVLFRNCQFSKNVSLSKGDAPPNNSFDEPLFNDCKFTEELSFRDVKIKSRVFNNTDTDFLKISKLTIENCEIDEKFILNKLKINSLLIKDSIFKSKVELKDNEIDEIKIINTNFKGLFDSFGTEYRKFYCFKSIYSDFVGFEDCKFSELATFKYVTFLSFTNFRNATFNQGLDLQTTNLKEAPNFLNIDVSLNNTNRETLRIIKDSFDKIGNHIEANKFFGREMCKYKEELAGKPLSQEKIIFWLNKGISNFGQSYIRPIGWILVFSVIYALLIYGYEHNWLYGILPVANEEIDFIVGIFNGFASNLIPFKSILKEGMEFVSLIFYITFASLIWQTIVAVKRHTRRS